MALVRGDQHPGSLMPSLPSTDSRPFWKSEDTTQFEDPAQTSTTRNVVCSRCQALFTQPTFDPESHLLQPSEEFHRTLTEVAEAATKEDCIVCAATLVEFGITPEDITPEFGSVILAFALYWDDDDHRFTQINVQSPARFMFVSIQQVQRGPSLGNLSARNTGARSCQGIATSWLDDCVKHHEECRQNHGSTDWVPSRLIDVGMRNGSQKPRLILRSEITSDVTPYPKYFTLSHRWSSNPVIKLLSSNIDSFRQGLPVEELSDTFLDAIRVTHALGVQYLWIDSLCIIQDSRDDWLAESVQMSRVYGNCLLNIAATASSDLTGGLFQERPASLVSSTPFRIQCKGHDRWYRALLRDKWNEDISRSVINRRAWVMQERMLSPRTLHFAKQLYWECKSLLASEGYLNGIPRPSGSLFHHALEIPTSLKGWETRERLYEWLQMIRTYASCGITKPEDRLVAISGIAKAIQAKTKDEYLAGLWRSELPYTLAWRFIHPTTPVQRPESYICPSWSWASLEANGGMITYAYSVPDPEARALVKVIDAQVQPVGLDPFGMLRGGYVRLAGRVGPMSSSSEFRMAMDVADGPPDYSLLHYLPIFYVVPDYLVCLLLKPIERGLFDFVRVGHVLLVLDGNLSHELNLLKQWVEMEPLSRQYVEVTIY